MKRIFMVSAVLGLILGLAQISLQCRTVLTAYGYGGDGTAPAPPVDVMRAWASFMK